MPIGLHDFGQPSGSQESFFSITPGFGRRLIDVFFFEGLDLLVSFIALLYTAWEERLKL